MVAGKSFASTVREVMVLPPYVHAGWSGARRLAGGGGDRLRVCETNVSLETVVWTAQKPLTFPETVPETVVKPNVFSETVAFLFEVHIEFLTLIRTPRSPRKSWVYNSLQNGLQEMHGFFKQSTRRSPRKQLLSQRRRRSRPSVLEMQFGRKLITSRSVGCHGL